MSNILIWGLNGMREKMDNLSKKSVLQKKIIKWILSGVINALILNLFCFVFVALFEKLQYEEILEVIWKISLILLFGGVIAIINIFIKEDNVLSFLCAIVLMLISSSISGMLLLAVVRIFFLRSLELGLGGGLILGAYFIDFAVGIIMGCVINLIFTLSRKRGLI